MRDETAKQIAAACRKEWESVNDPPCHPSESNGCPICIGAVIDAKDARIAELEAALKPFADEADNWDDEMDPDSRKIDDLGISDITYGHCRTARAVLKGSTDD